MGIHFKTDETFRDDFSYRNSDAAVLRFPFPFGEDTYRYSVNIEPHVKAGRRLPSNTRSMWTNITSRNAGSARSSSITIRNGVRCCRT